MLLYFAAAKLNDAVKVPEVFMRCREMKNGDKVSLLGFGAMRFKEKNGYIDEEYAGKLLDYALEKGINYFDTAWPYHNGAGEPFIGKFFEGEKRKKIYLATKLPHWMINETKDMRDIFEKQLKRLRTDYIDYYLAHAMDINSWNKIKELGACGFFDELKKDGLIRQAGFSFHGREQDFEEILNAYDWDFCQIQYNILDEKFQAGKKGLKLAHKKGVKVIIMEPLRGGSLAGRIPEKALSVMREADAGKKPVEWMLGWVFNHPEVTSVLSGMSTIEQIEENCAIAEKTEALSFTEKELETIEKIKKEYKKIMKTGCTGCRYCMPCPQGVNIPGCFEFYNARYMFGDKLKQHALYAVWVAGGIGGPSGQASLCNECGVCEEKCPQNIEIRKELKNVKKEFDGFMLKPVMFMAKRMLKKRGEKGKSQSERLEQKKP